MIKNLRTYSAVQKAVDKLIKKYGEEKTIEIIKADPAKGIFKERQHYPSGVMIFCDGGGEVLVGTTKWDI